MPNTLEPITSDTKWDPTFKAAVLAKLRDPSTRQAMYTLVDGEPGSFRYCCLGVACIVAGELGMADIAIVPNPTSGGAGYGIESFDSNGVTFGGAVLPRVVRNAITINDYPSPDPLFLIPAARLRELSDHQSLDEFASDVSVEVAALDLNDTYMLSFAQIADIFEEAL